MTAVKIPVLGTLVALATLAVLVLATPAFATGCATGSPCTVYVNNVGYGGTCGVVGTACDCQAGTYNQQQDGCIHGIL